MIDKNISDLVLPLDGGINFRDLGGYPAVGGRRVRRGMLFRAGALNLLSQKDAEWLAAVPVSHILDYRDTDEIEAKPDTLWSGVHYHPLPANPLSHEVNANLERLTSETLTTFDADAFMHTLYRLLPFNNQAYQQLVMLLLQRPAGGLVQHCAVGKDRTGVGVALTLLALGVDEKTVMEDYLLTNITLAPFREQMLAQYATSLNDLALAKLVRVLSARKDFLQTALTAIREQYGSVTGWLEHEYGLGSVQREQLQAYYLEPSS